MRGGSIQYTKSYFEGEVARLTQLLQQGISSEQRVQYQTELASAKQHLAEYNK